MCVSVVHHKANVYRFSAKRKNSYVQAEVDCNSFVPFLKIKYFSSCWNYRNSTDPDSIRTRLLVSILQKVCKRFDLPKSTSVYARVSGYDQAAYHAIGFDMLCNMHQHLEMETTIEHMFLHVKTR